MTWHRYRILDSDFQTKKLQSNESLLLLSLFVQAWNVFVFVHTVESTAARTDVV